MTREEIVTALRCCAFNGEDSCKHCTECPAAGDDCESELQFAAADLIENQQREIEALRWSNEGVSGDVDDEQGCGLLEDVIWEVDAQPAADVDSVVRCKDCYQSAVIGEVLYCTYWGKNTDENGYCHEGG